MPHEVVQERVMQAVRSHFRPEFLNRVDEIIVFHRLSREDLREIVTIQARGLAARLEQRGLHLEFTEAAKDWLAEHGYDPSYGARPLKRVLQKEVADRLALELLEGQFQEGDTIVVDTVDGQIQFRKS